MAWYPANRERIKKDYDEMKSRFWRPKTGENLIRILPPWSEEGSFYKKTYVHFGIGEEKRAFNCPRRATPPKPCPICEMVDALNRSGNSVDSLEAREYSARRQFMTNIIDLKDVNAGVQIYSFGIKVFEALMQYFNDPEWGDFTDPENGHDIILTKNGEGRVVFYEVRLRKNSTPVDDRKWLENLNDLDSAAALESYGELKFHLLGQVETTPEEIEEKAVVDDDGEDMESIMNKVLGSDLLDDGALSLEDDSEAADEDDSASFGPPDCFGSFNMKDKKCRECAYQKHCIQESVEAAPAGKRK